MHIKRITILSGLLLLYSGFAAAQIVFTVGTTFTGSTRAESGFIPPDTMGAVGPSHIVEMINGRFAVYNRSGAQQQAKTLDQFWIAAGVTPATFAFDPRVLYDNFSSRWFGCSVDNPGAANNFLVAVSDTSDPTGTWTGFQIDTDGDDSNWADFPMMGMNADVVVISANMFPLTGGASNTSVLVLPKADLLAASPTAANATLFGDINPSGTGFTPQPIVDLDNGNLPLPILSSFNKPAGFLKVSSIGGTAISPTLNTTGGSITVTARGAPPDIDQPGMKTHVDAGTSRFSGNVFQRLIPGRTNPSLWAAEGVNIGGRAAIEWYEIDAVTNAVLQSQTVEDLSLAFNYPSIAVNEFGEVVLGFSGGDPSTFISTYAVAGATTAGVTTLGALTLTQAGVADYQALDGLGRNRWGDYSATVVDPSDSRKFWTFQEYVSATDVWAIRITELISPVPVELLSFGIE